jgi:hypothetical protein
MSVLANNLVEVLLSIVLMFNVGAYSFLWYKIRRVEEDVEQHDNMLIKIYKRIFGMEEDETDEGHLVETEREISHIEGRLDDIEDKIDIMQSKNNEAHSEVRGMILDMTDMLSREENLDMDRDDFEEIKR